LPLRSRRRPQQGRWSTHGSATQKPAAAALGRTGQ